MIDNFKDNPMRDSAVIYKSVFEQIKKLYSKDPEKAGELAIAAIELSLTGDISSEDFYIDLMLQDTKYLVAKNKERYDRKIEAKRQKAFEEGCYADIANLFLAGMSQKEIGEALGGIPQQTISYRLKVIREEYPELLEKE